LAELSIDGSLFAVPVVLCSPAKLEFRDQEEVLPYLHCPLLLSQLNSQCNKNGGMRDDLDCFNFQSFLLELKVVYFQLVKSVGIKSIFSFEAYFTSRHDFLLQS
jgi:hypothetical protein